MDRYELQDRYLDLTRIVLPSLGRTRGWVITEDHCFMRVVLDHVFGDCWYNHLERRLRAYKQLNDTQLSLAVSIAERMSKADADTIAQMNARSLKWRDKPAPHSLKTYPGRSVSVSSPASGSSAAKPDARVTARRVPMTDVERTQPEPEPASGQAASISFKIVEAEGAAEAQPATLDAAADVAPDVTPAAASASAATPRTSKASTWARLKSAGSIFRDTDTESTASR